MDCDIWFKSAKKAGVVWVLYICRTLLIVSFVFYVLHHVVLRMISCCPFTFLNDLSIRAHAIEVLEQ